jgi:hypothetical protein
VFSAERIQEQAEKLRKELGPIVQEEILKSREKIKKEMEQLQLEMQRNWLDI